MPRPNEDQKAEILRAIRQHLLLVGPREWDSLMAKYPTVSRPTFFRYIKLAREQEESAAASEGPGALRLAQQRIHAHVAKPEKITEKIKAHLPAMPSPAVIASNPVSAKQAFQFFAFMETIIEDSDMMREDNKTVGSNGKTKAKNPALMDKILGRRLAIAQTYLSAFETVYNSDKIRKLYDAIVEQVGKASPEIQMAVLAHMRELDNQIGLTINGDI